MMPPKETRCAEGRGRPEGETREVARGRTQSRVPLPSNLARVSEAARRNKSTRFTALLHHVDVDALGARFAASSGAPRREWMEKRWRAMKRISRRTSNDSTRRFIRVATGRSRSGGSIYPRPTAVRGRSAYLRWRTKSFRVRSPRSLAIYETDFLGFSYGFRPRRSPHQALAALHTTFMTLYVNWVLDADTQSFFDSVDHE